ncbi:MAG TPA: tetratricopeptide repeat protein [Candidatus Methylacidiphilales bacterium]|nr:tetratricopeptide repeat protein [Candidatus Methylacidiphilales bacterium]
MAKRHQRKKAAGRKVSSSSTGKAASIPSSPGPSRDWFWGLALVLGVILAYAPVWPAGFIWDDEGFVTGNPCITGPLGLKEIWTTSAADICPLSLTTIWLEYALWGLAPLPYHLVNVFQHAACTVLLWLVLKSLRIPGAWLGAALWALHPVQAESVAWITEIKNTQSTLFFLLSILFFIRYLQVKNGGKPMGSGRNYGLTLLFAALAMASKSSTVILPAIFCLCAWWMEGRWQWRNLARVIPVCLMAIASFALSVWTQGLPSETDPGLKQTRTWPERLATAGDAIWFYLGKLLWPHPLTAIYPRWDIDTGQWFSYLPLLAVIIMLFVLRHKSDSWSRPCFFAFAYFVTALLPILGLVNMGFFHYSLVADHFQYLASMGPLALAGAGLARFFDLIIPGKQWLQGVLGAGLSLVLAALSWQRAFLYASPEKLWTDTLAQNPDCWAAHNNLGEGYLKTDQLDKALAQFQETLAINPNYAEAHDNLGDVYLRKGLVDQAISEYQRAAQIDPAFAGAHDNFGNALLRKGKVDEAIAQYQKTLEINPNFTQAYYNLGIAFLQKGLADQAIIQFQTALKLDPNYAEACNNLGAALLEKGELDEAINQYQKALAINANYVEARTNFANALVQKGQMDDAVGQFQKALETDPYFALAHYSLGNALARQGQLDAASAQYQEALKIEPTNTKIHYNLGVTLFQKGDLNGAAAQFREALKLDPTNGRAQNSLVEIETMLEQRGRK